MNRRRAPSVFGFLRRNGMLNLRYARLLWRYLWRRFLTPAGWRWKTDGPVFFGTAPPAPDRQAGRDPLRLAQLDRRRHQDPLPRGGGRDRREDGDRPGVHDLRLQAGADRRAVRDRRPGDVHRLRPRRRPRSSGRSATRGSTSARSIVGSNVWIGYNACFLRGCGSATTRSSAPTRWSPGRPRERRGRRRPGEADPDARGAQARCAGPIRSSRRPAARAACPRRRGRRRGADQPPEHPEQELARWSRRPTAARGRPRSAAGRTRSAR